MPISILPKKSMTFTWAILCLRKNSVVPVGHRRCLLLGSGPLERPEVLFLDAGFKSAEEWMKQNVTQEFGESVTIAEVNGAVE